MPREGHDRLDLAANQDGLREVPAGREGFATDRQGTLMHGSSTAPARPLAALVARAVLLGGLVLVFARASQYYATSVLNHDVSWFIVAARRLVEGGRFGSDIYELNAPGAVLIYVPAAWLWKLTAWPVELVLVGYVLALTALCLALIGWLLRRELGPGGGQLRDAYLLFAAAVLLTLPVSDFGQREHLIVILMLPYCLTQALVGEGTPPPALFRGSAAALAAIAISIKPIYVPFPLLLMAVQAQHLGLRRVFASIEMGVFLALGTVYLASVVFLFPEWIEIARRASQLYGAYGNAEYFSWSTVKWLGLALPPLAIAAGLNHASIRSRNPVLHRWVNALLLFAALALLLYVVQKRGWSYHRLPVKLVLGMALGACLVTGARCFTRPAIEAAAVWALAIVAAAATLLSLTQARKDPKQAYRDTDLAQVVSRLANPPVVSFFATSLGPAFPLVTELGLDWGSRFPCLWTLAGLRYQELLREAGPRQGEQALSAAELSALEEEIVAMVVADLDRYQPSLVVVDERERKQAVDPDFDILARLSQHARFREAWRPYTKTETSGPYVMYQRSSAPRRAAQPLRGSRQNSKKLNH